MDNFDNGTAPLRRASGAPNNAAPAPTVAECPECGRKLLSTRSILCNWCGARIDDPEYLERAAQERAVLDARVRGQIDRENAESAQFGVLGRLKRKRKAGVSDRPNVLMPTDEL